MKKIIAVVLVLMLIGSVFTVDWYIHKDYKLDEKTGVLTVSGMVDELLITHYLDNAHVKSIVAVEGCVLPENCNMLFSGITKKMPNLECIDLSKADSSNVKIACNMFSNNEELKTLITNMCGMFKDCSALEELDLGGFDTSSVTTMAGMFMNCSSLKKLDLSGFNTANVIYMDDMFLGCKDLEIVDMSSFDTSKVESTECMFCDCSRLKIIDLSSFETTKLKEMDQMFMFCTALETIYVNSRWRTHKTNDKIFISCFRLVGGEGTKFDQDYQDYLYAKIDQGADDPGYFTLKE